MPDQPKQRKRREMVTKVVRHKLLRCPWCERWKGVYVVRTMASSERERQQLCGCECGGPRFYALAD